MNKLYTICLLFLLAACSQPDARLKAIESDIKHNALGMDIGYQPGTLDTILIVTQKQAINDLSSELGHDLTRELPKAIEVYTNTYTKALADDDSAVYYVWKYEVDRMKRLQASKPTDIDYSVYRYNYSVINQMNKNERIKVQLYYFFDHADSIVGHLTGTQLTEFKNNYRKSKSHPYSIALISLATGVDL